jgi:monothiol glutaredoxin
MTIEDKINNLISVNKVLLFMKGNPKFPQCGFSSTACQILDASGISYETIDVLQDPDIREGIKTFSNWPTIPQLYVKEEFIGGCDIIKEMYENGELKKVFKDKGISFKN